MGSFFSTQSEHSEFDDEAEYDRDHLRTIVLSHKDANKDVNGLVEALGRQEQLILKRKKDVGISSNKDADDNTGKLVDCIRSLNGVLIVYTPGFEKLWSGASDQEPAVQKIEISGEATAINVSKFQEKVQEDKGFLKNIIALKLPRDNDDDMQKLTELPEEQIVNLPRDGPVGKNETLYDLWVPLIVPKLLERKKINRLISQSSIDN